MTSSEALARLRALIQEVMDAHNATVVLETTDGSSDRHADIISALHRKNAALAKLEEGAVEALGPLLDAAEALVKLLPEAINDRYVTQSSAVDKARAALDALAKLGERND